MGLFVQQHQGHCATEMLNWSLQKKNVDNLQMHILALHIAVRLPETGRFTCMYVFSYLPSAVAQPDKLWAGRIHCFSSYNTEVAVSAFSDWIAMKVIYLGWIFSTILCWWIFQTLCYLQIQLAVLSSEAVNEQQCQFLKKSTSMSRQPGHFFPS